MSPATTLGINGKLDHDRPSLGKAALQCVVHLVGPPGCGKTALIEATVRRLSSRAQIGAIIAHPAATRDAAALQRAGAWALALDAAPQADAVADAIERMPHRLDLLFVESPELLNTTSSTRVAVFSVAGGDSKAAELPEELLDAELVVLTKSDLLPHVRFDLDLFRDDVKRLNPKARLIELSSTQGAGLIQWTDWLLARVIQSRTTHGRGVTPDMAEWWFG
jgi:hydrogenase nickel incorporation protein HypB